MSPKELLDLANKAYPDEYLCEYYNKDGQRKTGCGDKLAEFIVVELLETYDPDGTNEQQLRTAMKKINRAILNLKAVFNSLQEKDC
jgi:hypothetical protein